jgi:hypothetical protein
MLPVPREDLSFHDNCDPDHIRSCIFLLPTRSLAITVRKQWQSSHRPAGAGQPLQGRPQHGLPRRGHPFGSLWLSS